MKVYEVIHGPLLVGAGTTVLLTGAQLADRQHAVANLRPCGDAYLVDLETNQTFPAGEFVGMRECPPAPSHLVREVTDAPPHSLARRLVDAASRSPI